MRSVCNVHEKCQTRKNSGQLGLSPGNIQEVLACAAQLQVRKQTTLERTQNQDYLIYKPNTFSFIILLCFPDQVSGPLYIPILILILILLLLCFPDQVSGPPLLELHGVRSRSRELRRHLISRRHILPPKAEASGFFQRKKNIQELKNYPPGVALHVREP